MQLKQEDAEKFFRYVYDFLVPTNARGIIRWCRPAIPLNDGRLMIGRCMFCHGEIFVNEELMQAINGNRQPNQDSPMDMIDAVLSTHYHVPPQPLTELEKRQVRIGLVHRNGIIHRRRKRQHGIVCAYSHVVACY